MASASHADTSDESIVVTATRLPKTAARSTALSVLDVRDLERRQTGFLVDALANLPGVNVSQNGAFGGSATLRLRGAASEQTLVLVDGVTVNDTTGAGGGYNFAFLDAASIERVEVLRGPQSTLWGSDAIAGVVNIITKRPTPGFAFSGLLEGGSYETARGSAAFNGRFDSFDVRLGASGISTNGISKADAQDGNPETDPYRAWTMTGRAGISLTDAARLELFGRFTDSENFFDRSGGPTGVRDGDEVATTREAVYGVVGRFSLFDGRMQNIVQASGLDIERRNLTGGVISFAAEGRRDAVRYQATISAAEGIDFVAGAEHERATSNTGSGSSAITVNGAFALAEANIAETIVINGGVRYDDNSRFGGVTTGSLGAFWTPIESLTFSANWSQGFKAPTIYQLTMFFPPATSPNGDLLPEEAEGWDIGMTADLLDGRMKASIAWFDLKTQNLIQYQAGRYMNVARAHSNGVEAALAITLENGISVRASYTYTDARNAITDLPLARTPEHAGSLELDWQVDGAFGVTAMLRYNGEETDTVRVANPDGIVDAWTRIDFAARYRVSDTVEIYGRVENIADAHYQDIFGYGAPGRSAYAGIRLTFE